MSSSSKKYQKVFLALLCTVLILVFCVLPINAAKITENDEVYLGGCLFGVQMQTKGIPIVGIDKVQTSNGVSYPAYDAGIKPKDIIIKINGKAVSNVNDVLKSISECDGNAIQLDILRGCDEQTVYLTPKIGGDGKYHAGIWIRDSAAGIGTVTYIDPKTGEFAGLGHGICDSDTASLLPLSRGIVTEVELNGICKGKKGAPGEIKGTFKGTKIGSLVKNTSKGVYGIYSTVPSGISKKIKLAKFDEVKEGEATIRCSVSGEIKEYKIEIKKITKSDKGKNFSIKVVDDALLQITGGIVQGMSGSPIIQNGKLVGAVTHVTVNDPTEGYGIFIGNMM